MEPMHLVREFALSVFLHRVPPAGSGGECQPQLPWHHDGYSVANGLCLLHVVCGDNGPSLAVLEGSAEGSPARTDRQNRWQENLWRSTRLLLMETGVSPHALFGFGVHSRRRLIQKDDLRVSDHAKCKAQLQEVADTVVQVQWGNVSCGVKMYPTLLYGWEEKTLQCYTMFASLLIVFEKPYCVIQTGPGFTLSEYK